MRGQFLHLDTYGLSASIGRDGKHRLSGPQVLREASRIPGNCPHVENPQKPEVLYGSEPEDLIDILEETHASARQSNGRTLRKNASLILCGVVSWPEAWPKVNKELLGEWYTRSTNWILKTWPDTTRAILTHNDETHPHMHFYAMPWVKDGKVKIGDVHPGYAARDALRGESDSRKDSDNAFKGAMRDLQDDYWRDVGVPCGMSRFSVSRRRLSRADWHTQDKESRLLKMAHSFLDGAEAGRAAKEAARLVVEAEEKAHAHAKENLQLKAALRTYKLEMERFAREQEAGNARPDEATDKTTEKVFQDFQRQQSQETRSGAAPRTSSPIPDFVPAEDKNRAFSNFQRDMAREKASKPLNSGVQSAPLKEETKRAFEKFHREQTLAAQAGLPVKKNSWRSRDDGR